MAVLFTDDFNRADSTNMGAAWSEALGGWEISSNEANPTDGATECLCVTTTSGHAAVADVQVSTKIKIANSGDQGVVFRKTAATTYYLVQGEWSNSRMALWVRVTGTWTLLNTWPASGFGGLVDGAILKVAMLGSRITIHYNGTLVGEWLTTTITGAGQTGMRSWQAASTGRFDDFLVEDAEVTTPPVGAFVQPIFQFLSMTSASYFPMLIHSLDNFASTFNQLPIAAPGKIRNFKIIATAGTGVANSWRILQMMKNSATAIMMASGVLDTTVLDASRPDSAVPVSAGDWIGWTQFRSGGPNTQAVHVTYDWEPDDGVTQLYGWVSTSLTQTSATTHYIGIFGNIFRDSTESIASSLINIAGTITSHYIRSNFAPGTGVTKTYTIMLTRGGSTVAQDGSGGTPDTRVTISGNAQQQNSATFSLAVLPGDQLSVRVQVSGGTAADIAALGTFTFTPTITNRLHHGGMSAPPSVPGGPYTNYWFPVFCRNSPDTTLANRRLLGHFTPIRLYGIRAILTEDQMDPGESRALTLVQNDVDLTSTTVTLPDGTLVISATWDPPIDIIDSDTFSLKEVAIGNITAGGMLKWAFDIGQQPVTLQGSTVFGVNTTVTVKQAIAMGLDGNTNVHNTVGQHKVFGNMHVTGTLTVGGNLTGGSAALDGMGQ